MTSKKQLKNNFNLSLGLDSLKGVNVDSILIIRDSLDWSGSESIEDYFSVVITDNYNTNNLNIRFDISIYEEFSSYSNNVIINFPENEELLHMLNFDSMVERARVSNKPNVFNLNFTPVIGSASSQFLESKYNVLNGLAADQMGVHLAKIIGATKIFSTYSADGVTLATEESLRSHVDEKVNYIPVNYIGERQSFINLIF